MVYKHNNTLAVQGHLGNIAVSSSNFMLYSEHIILRVMAFMASYGTRQKIVLDCVLLPHEYIHELLIKLIP